MVLADHDLRMLPLEAAQHVGIVVVRGGGLSHPKASQDAAALFVRAFHRHGEGIDTRLERQVQVLRRPPPHHAHVVFFDPFAPLQTGLRAVEEGFARTQAVDQGIHVGSQDLVHGLPPLMQAHRGFVAVDAVVTCVVVVDQFWLLHGCLFSGEALIKYVICLELPEASSTPGRMLAECSYFSSTTPSRSILANISLYSVVPSSSQYSVNMGAS